MACYARRAKRLIALFAMIVAAIGCSGNKPQPANYHIYSEADNRLNLDFTDRPLSVVLNVYQLKDRQTFARLTFEDFVSGKTDESLFGDDVVSKSEFVVLPGDKQSIDTKLAPEAKYIGIVAVYRMPADQQWRYLIPAEQIREKSFWGFAKEKTVSIRLHSCYMTIDGVGVDLIPGQKAGSDPSCSAVTAVAGPSIKTGTASTSITTNTEPSLSDKTRTTAETASSVAKTASSVSDTASSVSKTAKTAGSLAKP